MTLTEFLQSNQTAIIADFIKKADELGLEYIYKDEYYLWIKGNTNIAVTAHVDTVDIKYASRLDSMPIQNPEPKMIVEDKGILTAYRNETRCILGGDDRVGVHICYEQLSKSLEEIPHIFLFNGEEVGGIGSNEFCQDKPNLDMIELMIAVDCPYNNEFVWYGDNRSADKWVESFGWHNRGRGIFTDIANIGYYYDFPCVNLGCGYFKQHTPEEYIDIEIMEMSKRKLNRMLEEGYVPKLEQIALDCIDDFFFEDEAHCYEWGSQNC